jgi:hypothetical protein
LGSANWRIGSSPKTILAGRFAVFLDFQRDPDGTFYLKRNAKN